ncbi:MAG: hypothetical protein HZA90_01090, partial [Verrucomicrobia bacterium]|nr:hypothetical protein [Verrucomicrobiota bacterium]
IQGTASDNGGVAEVQFKLNNEPWEPGHGTTNWHRPKTLTPGSNTVWAYALDAAGNRSVTQQVKFVYVLTGQLTLRTNGVGTITRTFTGSTLEVGQTYTVTAVPGAGQVFSNWTDGAGQVVTNAAACAFKMQTDLILQANFMPNPFVAAKGDYNGLFYPMDWAIAATAGVSNSGAVKLTLTDQGAFTGSLLMEGGTLNLSGKFNAGLQSQVSVTRAGKPALQVNLQIMGNTVTGAVASAGWQSSLAGYRAAGAAARAGAYTMLVEGVPSSPTAPPGDGAAAVTVSVSGQVQVTGNLADRAPITQSTALSADGIWPLYVSLYNGRGLVMGWMRLGTNGAIVVSECFWQKPPQVSGDKFYTNGFTVQREVLLAKYTPPAAGQNGVNWPNGWGQVTLSFGNAPDVIGYVVVSNNQVRVLGGAIAGLAMTITANNGLFSGSFTHPVTGGKSNFLGAFIQSAVPGLSLPTSGGGWFLGTNQGGRVAVSQSAIDPSTYWAPTSPLGQTWKFVDGLDNWTTVVAFTNASKALDIDAETNGVLSYSYQSTGPATATMHAATSNNQIDLTLNFTADGVGTYQGYETRDGGRAIYGSFTIMKTDYAPASLARWQLTSTDSEDGWESVVLFTTAGAGFDVDLEEFFSVTYTYSRIAPNVAFVQLNSPVNVARVMVAFTSAQTGFASGTHTRGGLHWSGSYLHFDYAPWTDSTVGLAPANLTQTRFDTVDEDGWRSTIKFHDTHGGSAYDPEDGITDFSYSLVRLSPDVLRANASVPGQGSTYVVFTFRTANSG